MITAPGDPQPVDFADVRATNLAVVLRYVRGHAPCSRAGVAAATGLNKATVSSLVGELLERRLVRETGLTEHRIGRPATMLVPDGGAYAAVGLALGADQLTAVALDLTGERLLSWRRAWPGPGAPPGKVVASVTALARRALASLAGQGRRVLGVTVGAPGLVDAEGVVRAAPQLGWSDIDLRGRLVAALGRPTGAPDGREPAPVQVDRAANLAAVAEQRWGAHPGVVDLAYLTGGPDLAAGLIAGGRLLRGARGFAGELGHVELDPAGPECGCGRRGCLEALAGVAALVRRANPDAFAGGDPTDWEPEVAELARRAQAQDKLVLDGLAEVGGWLGAGAAVLANLLNPELVVLGGYYPPLAEWLLPAAQEELARRTAAPGAGGARLVASRLGHDAAALGGAATVLETVDAGHLPTLSTGAPASPGAAA